MHSDICKRVHPCTHAHAHARVQARCRRVISRKCGRVRVCQSARRTWIKYKTCDVCFSLIRTIGLFKLDTYGVSFAFRPLVGAFFAKHVLQCTTRAGLLIDCCHDYGSVSPLIAAGDDGYVWAHVNWPDSTSQQIKRTCFSVRMRWC